MFYDFSLPGGSWEGILRNYNKSLEKNMNERRLALRLVRLRYACEYAQQLAQRCWLYSRRRRWLKRAAAHAYEALHLQEEEGTSQFPLSERDYLVILGALVEGHGDHREIARERFAMLVQPGEPVLEMQYRAIGYQLAVDEPAASQLLLEMAERAVVWWHEDMAPFERSRLARAMLWIKSEARRRRFKIVVDFF